MKAGEIQEKIEHSSSRRIALLIAVLALALAMFESLGKAYQTEAISLQVKSANLWAFYQAKSAKLHATELARSIVIEISDKKTLNESNALRKWAEDVKRFSSNEEDGDGKSQIFEKARAAEAERDLMFLKYEYMEIASTMLQVAIVLASAAVITNVLLLVVAARGLGVLATVIGVIGVLFPNIFKGVSV